MKKKDAMELMEKRCWERNLAHATVKTYLGWFGQFCDWRLKEGNRDKGPEEFLGFLATDRRVNWRTQKQALNALNFFWKHCLGKDLGRLNFRGGSSFQRVPTWLTMEECSRLFGEMRGIVPRLQAGLMVGCGFRRKEVLTLRVKDLDFSGQTITVRGGKGDKDRTVPMPRALMGDLKEQVDRATRLWQVDRQAGHPAPEISESLGRKLGRAQMESLGWFWLFPAAGLSVDPKTKIRRRHHVTERGLAKAVVTAARSARFTKRVTPHTLRHSYAMALVIAGTDVRTISTLMGHANVTTTEIYLHAVPQLALRVSSPLDASPGNVVPMFDTGEDRGERLAS